MVSWCYSGLKWLLKNLSTMNVINMSHQIAMDICLLGDLAKQKAEAKKALQYYKNAFAFEQEAALLANSQKSEDIFEKFVLLRSAATIASLAGLWRESNSLVDLCLKKNPPQWLVAELDDITATNKAALTQEKVVDITGKVSMINADDNVVTLKSEQAQKRFFLSFSENHLEDLLNHFNQNIEVEAKKLAHGVMVLQKIKVAA